MFTFKGVKASDMGINVLPFTRQLKALQRTIQTYIPGRQGINVYSDNTYDNGVISLPCVYFGSRSPTTLRQVAAWLTGGGSLVFDSEPDKHYEASVFEIIDLEEQLFEGLFTITFTVFPFALSDENAVASTLEASGDNIKVTTNGTAQTPCRITITNNTNETISNLRIVRRV